MSQPKKILALHGVAQSGPVFQRRCQNIVDHLIPLGYTVHFLTAPHGIEGTAYTVARQADYVEGDLERSWWTTDDENESHPSIALFLGTVADAIRQHGPFTAAMGFSQGGCAAASITAMLEPSRRRSKMARKYLGEDVLSIQPPLAFLILFSANPYRFPLSEANDVDVRPLFYPQGFSEYPYSKLTISTRETLAISSNKSTISPHSPHSPPAYAAYSPHSISTPQVNTLTTPTLSFYGQKEWERDPFSRSRQQWFISRFTDVQVQAHPWKHTVPRTDEYAEVMVGFVRRVEMEGSGRNGKPARAKASL